MLTETFREALDSEIDFPFDLLAIVAAYLSFRVKPLTLVDRLAHFIDVRAIVDCADEVVNDLKKPRRVLAKIETLSWC